MSALRLLAAVTVACVWVNCCCTGGDLQVQMYNDAEVFQNNSMADMTAFFTPTFGQFGIICSAKPMKYGCSKVHAVQHPKVWWLLPNGDKVRTNGSTHMIMDVGEDCAKLRSTGTINPEDSYDEYPVPSPIISSPISVYYDRNSKDLSFILNCSSTMFPATNISWSRNGEMLSNAMYSQTQILRNRTTVAYDNLLHVSDGSNGTYECNVTNIFGSTLSKPINLNVPTAPQNLQVNSNTMMLSWTPESLIFIESYHLQHRGGCMNSSQTEKLPASRHEADITGLDGNSTYTVHLWASNVIGDSPHSTLNITTPSKAPAGSPRILKSHSDSPTSILIAWEEVECSLRGGHIISYRVEYWHNAGNESCSSTVFNTNARIGNLTADTGYHLRVAAVNVNGSGPFSSVIDVTTTSEVPTVAIAASSAGGLLVVAVCVLVCVGTAVYCRHRRSSKSLHAEFPNELLFALSEEAEGGEPVVDYFPPNIVACEGEYVVIQVSVSGRPEPAITWTSENRDIENDATIELRADGTMIIPSTEACHEGVYCMSASNAYGSVTRELCVRLEGEKTETHGQRLPKNEDKPIPLRVFGDYVTRNHENANEGFQIQFMCLNNEPEKTTAVAMIPENKSLNRFKSIVPYDDNRIFLNPISGISNCQHDYINASYIDGYQHSSKFIATQGPLPHTVIDFWRAVWQEKCPIIVMLNNIVEGGRVRCQQYWPNSSSHTYGPFTVELVKEKLFADYTVRTLTVTLTTSPDSPITVTQFHFTSWPDHSVPDYASPLLMLHKKMASMYNPNSGPILVHCSTGVGRTGTFITISLALEQAKSEEVVNIAGIINRMRQQRMKMVQTPVQYIFIHDSVLECLVCGETQVSTTNFLIAQRTLGKVDKETERDGFERQYRLLQKITPKPYEVMNVTSRSDLASSMELFEREQRRLDGISGTYVDGYKKKKAFIFIDDPVKECCSELWRIVHQQEIAAIVMFSIFGGSKQDRCYQYWPTAGMIEYGDFSVFMMTESRNPNFIARTLQVTPINGGRVITVTQFEVLNWTLDGECSDLNSVVVLDRELQHALQRSSGNPPIIFHSKDCVGCCAIFCAAMTAIEQCKTEAVVDVFQVVKNIRMQKPGSVLNARQYRLIFSLVTAYLDSMTGYSNFK